MNIKPISAGSLALCVLLGCGAAEPSASSGTEADPAEQGTDGVLANAAEADVREQPSGIAQVLESMDAGPYTYVRIDWEGREVWFAAPTFKVAVGDTVALTGTSAPMHGFRSNSLNRTFDEIYFAGSLKSNNAERAAASEVEKAHAGVNLPEAPPEVGQGEISRPEGGKTVEEIYAAPAEMAGQEILLRARVVKFTPRIMGSNWIHVRDGTGGEGTNDLTVTTQDKAEVGDLVLVRGSLVVDKDFGAGYRFARLLEKATVTVE